MTETATEFDAGSPASIQWQIPKEFYSLGLELEAAERSAYLDSMAAEIWANGTDYQRETVAYWYKEIAEAAADDGALEAAFCMLRTEEGRVTTATLSVMAEPIASPGDAQTVIAGLVEALSNDPLNEVMEVNAESGPAVLTLSGMHMTARQGVEDSVAPVTLELAQATVYVPCLPVSQLVVLTLTTPSIQDFPDYVGVLARVTDSVKVNMEQKPAGPAQRRPTDAHPSTLSVRDVFG
ncbi:hypothetical protein [Streptomyces sp. NPDC006134]|uniref:hypothetical protein n=1 Tax=Streptomyces sp. NPDC006134 TaxID=3154467 RepID=UPI0033F02172